MSETMQCGCPGSLSRVIEPATQATNDKVTIASELRQWPVQLHLVPTSAPYFKNADLLVAADCVATAMGNFHQDLLKGRALAIACPKLDRTEGYVEKLATLIRDNDLKSLTVAIMEVPCCRGLDMLVRQAATQAGSPLEVKTLVIGLDGTVRS